MSITFSPDTLKFAVIDPEPAVASALSIGFGLRWPECQVFTATAGIPGISLIETTLPQLVVTEVQLPDIDGYEFIRRIRRFSDVPIIVLSKETDEMSVVRALELGADDFVSKPPSPLGFLARARAVLRRYTAYPDGHQDLPRYKAGRLIIDFAQRQVCIDGEYKHLTPLEFFILSQLVRNEGRVVAIDALRRPSNDGEYDTSPETIRKMVCQLRQKLDIENSHCQIFNERGIGYRFVGQSYTPIQTDDFDFSLS